MAKRWWKKLPKQILPEAIWSFMESLWDDHLKEIWEENVGKPLRLLAKLTGAFAVTFWGFLESLSWPELVAIFCAVFLFLLVGIHMVRSLSERPRASIPPSPTVRESAADRAAFHSLDSPAVDIQVEPHKHGGLIVKAIQDLDDQALPAYVIYQHIRRLVAGRPTPEKEFTNETTNLFKYDNGRLVPTSGGLKDLRLFRHDPGAWWIVSIKSGTPTIHWWWPDRQPGEKTLPRGDWEITMQVIFPKVCATKKIHVACDGSSVQILTPGPESGIVKPLIKGEAYDFKQRGASGRTSGDGPGPNHIWRKIAFDLDLCNHAPIATNLKDLTIDGSKLTPPVDFRNIVRPPLLDLPHAINKHIRIETDLTVYGPYDSIPSIDMTKLVITVTDGLNEKHMIPVREGESLKRSGS